MNSPRGTVETARGQVLPADLGRTLMHEHVFIVSSEHVTNYGYGKWWDDQEREDDAVAKLTALKSAGIDTIVDLTVLGGGRDVARIAKIAARVEVNIVVATGLYTTDELPQPYQYRGPGTLFDMPEPLVADFTRDITEGIAETGVRAGVLKCVVEAKGLTPGVDRVARAVAATHVELGTPITVHTDSASQSGRLAVKLFTEERVDLTKVVIGHAGDSTDLDYLMELADTGATLGMDRFGLDLYGNTEARVGVVAALAARGYADRMVLSHDAGCFGDFLAEGSEPFRAQYLPNWQYRYIPDEVLPMLRAAGVTEQQIEQMLIDNPRRYFAAATSC